ncbi:MAG: Nif3-like dinuclear metal center hexameric protein [Crocinitomicaceae bacterium]|nr:Nif3-like dinuclear metal center hexameric protein [Crocinitomicaceae bacterium]
MKISEITSYLEGLAPLSSQESYDNSGLIVGNGNDEVTQVLISLDCIESTIDEAIEKGCELIIAHHPIVFKGLRKLNGTDYVQRTVLKAIKNDIAIYAIHTNLDNYRFGVNAEIGRRLGLRNLRVLSPKENVLNKLAVFVPTDHKEKVKEALFRSGAGSIGDYRECSFETSGIGTFKPVNNATPFDGEIDKRNTVSEVRIEVLVSSHQLRNVISSMKLAHPYEEVAYEVYTIENENQFEGAGMIGDLVKPLEEFEMLQLIKETFKCGVIRHTKLRTRKINTIAFCGGSGSFLLRDAIRQKADIYITADYKYHEFFDADNRIIIADIGHYESEQYTSDLLADILMKKFPTFAVHLTEVNTNPINYF